MNLKKEIEAAKRPKSISAEPPKLIAIAAMSRNRVIGRDNQLPWHLPEEFAWFKKATTGKVLLMGRKTFESLGKPLPGRRNLVLTRGKWSHPGVEVVRTLDEALEIANAPELWIGGGSEIYSMTLPWWSEAYVTTVKREVEGDAYFPEFEHLFPEPSTVFDGPDFRILHYVRTPEASRQGRPARSSTSSNARSI